MVYKNVANRYNANIHYRHKSTEFNCGRLMNEHSKEEEIRAVADLESIREWFSYNDHVRKKYLKALESLSGEQLMKDRGASFPSLLDISAHIFFAYRLWLIERYGGVPLDESDSFGRKCASIEDLKTDAEKMNPYILDFVQKLQPQDLGRWIERPRNGDSFSFNVKNMLWHLIEEELQHRGEINALLWQSDIDPPITGWGTWKRETGSSA
jgi:uncharacterized damage-inducible protein DinB